MINWIIVYVQNMKVNRFTLFNVKLKHCLFFFFFTKDMESVDWSPDYFVFCFISCFKLLNSCFEKLRKSHRKHLRWKQDFTLFCNSTKKVSITSILMQILGEPFRAPPDDRFFISVTVYLHTCPAMIILSKLTQRKKSFLTLMKE